MLKDGSDRAFRLATAGTAIYLLLALSSCTSNNPTPPPPTHGTLPTSTPTTSNPSPNGTAVPVDAALVSVRLAKVEGGTAASVNGQPAVQLRYLSGPANCGLLSRVEVTESADSVTVGVYVGDIAGETKVCDSINVAYHTLAVLKSPLGDRAIVDLSQK